MFHTWTKAQKKNVSPILRFIEQFIVPFFIQTHYVLGIEHCTCKKVYCP